MKHSFSLKDTVAVFGNQRTAIQAMLDYDYLCGKKKPSVVCVIDSAQSASEAEVIYFFGNREILLKSYKSVPLAAACKPTVFINFASARSAYAVSLEALEIPSVEKIIIIAEGMPERKARLLKQATKHHDKVMIGPATVGGLSAGILKIGNAGGTMENVVNVGLLKRGSVGIVSKSGGMLNELMTMVARQSDGVAEAIAIGGDRFPLTTLVEQVERFETNPDIKMILLLGEVGGLQEYEIVEALKAKKLRKPLVAWVSGTGASALTENIQFGHAGAMAQGEHETATAKNKALAAAGALVPSSFATLEKLLGETAKKLKIMPQPIEKPLLPRDLQAALKDGSVRHTKGIISSITPSHNGSATYLGHDITDTAAEKSLGYILGLLWFKQEFPPAICNFFELILKLTADHGPSVSGAHNTIIASRAGKDLVSSLTSGLLTIGPRFGGAVNEAATYFFDAYNSNTSAFDFVADMKAKNRYIPGIGHRVKSKTNPDERVALLISKATSLKIKLRYLTYAREVEAITTRKKDSLILNVDGAIAGILLDILSSTCSEVEIKELLQAEAFNAFFVLGRSVGLIGHFIDQKRLKQPLYRHPDWDTLEL